MSEAIFWLVVVAHGSQFAPSRIGPMTEERCHKAAEALGTGECRRVVGMMTCSADGHPGAAFVCPIFEGDISVPVGATR